MPTDLDPIALLARTDPAADLAVPGPPPLDELAARTGSPARPDAGAGPGTGGHRSRRLVLTAAVALVALLTAAAVLAARTASDGATEVPAAPTTTAPDAPPGEAAYPVPLDLGPGEPAAPALLALAATVEAAAEPERQGPTPLWYRRTVGWAQVVTVSGGSTTWVLEPFQEEEWSQPDGTGWRRDGTVADLAAAGADGPLIDTALPHPGPDAELVGPLPGLPWVRPTTPEEVAADLHVGQGEQPDAVNALDRAAEVLATPVTAADRAALLRALAAVTDIEHRGQVVDRAGRTGVAFSVRSDDAGADDEGVVVLDPGTGELLAIETVMWESASSIPIERPLVTGARTVLAGGWADEVGVRPGPTGEDTTEGDVGAVRVPLGAAEPAGGSLLALAEVVAADDRRRPDRVAYARGVGWAAEAGAGGVVRFQGSQVETWAVPGEPRTYRAGIVNLRSAGADGRADADVPRPSLTVDLMTTSSLAPASWERPGSVAEVREELLAAAGDASGPEAALTAATWILSWPTTGPERATLFRALAEVEGVEHRGTVTDRMGRTALALSVPIMREGEPAELVVLLDPATGELLASETVSLPTGPDDRPVVVQATTTVEVTWADEVGVRPDE